MDYKYDSALLYIADITAYSQVKVANVNFLFIPLHKFVARLTEYGHEY